LRFLLAPHAPLCLCARRLQLGSLVTFAWLVALKPKKKTD
jgi:hypothetical protein